MKILKMFYPFLYLIGGGLIWVWAGINDTPGTPSIFKAMTEMELWGWIGVPVFLFGILLYTRILRK